MQSPIRALLCGMGIWFVWVSLVVFSAQLLPTEVAGSALFVSMQMVALAAFVLGSTILYLRKVGEPPQVRREEIEPLSPDQVNTLFESVREDGLEALYVVAVTAGPRQGELLGLKWEDIDLDRSLLQVRRTLSSTKGGDPIFSSPKTAKGSRSVKLTANATQALKMHRERQLQEREALVGLWQEHDLVFPMRLGTPMSRHNLVNRSFKPLLRRAGLPDIRFHDLRHTCATLMLAVGTNPKVVQETLIHTNASVTLDTYSHLLPNMQDEVAWKINELLS
jgi:integrase